MMDKLKKNMVFYLLLLIDFYIVPWFIKNTGSAMIVMLVIIPLICLITSVFYGIRNGFNFWYILIVAIMFAPSIFIFYNSSAWVYVVGYAVIALLGNLIALPLGNGWRVSWCVGHLAGLADADSYDPKYAKWRYDDLPILPEHWQMVVGKDKKKQFDILKKLMNAPDVTEVVNACDAGREGELIFRSVYELAGCQKPMKRLWISSMEDSAIREGFANLRPGADYDGLRDAALCRAKADWLVGINATRLFSVLYHRTLNIGRVMSPTLALIVQREAEIDTFKPVPFYTVALELPGLTVSGERMADKAAAEQLKEVCQGAAVTIKKVECKEKSEKPPALYDLTTLQNQNQYSPRVPAENSCLYAGREKKRN